MVRQYSITMPLPDSILSGHVKGNNLWRRIKAAKESKANALRLWKSCNELVPPEPHALATLHIEFRFGTFRRRDTLNCVYGCKAVIDAAVDAGIIEDDDWTHLSIGSIKSKRDPQNVGMTITIEAVV